MKLQLLILIILSIPVNLISSEFNITRLKYQGGGDWYSDPSSIPNLLDFIEKETGIKTADSEIQATIGSSNFFNNPYYYITGHGNIKFSQKEREILREALLDGAFLHADDNYGMNDSFRKEMKEIFPEKEWVLFLEYFVQLSVLTFYLNLQMVYLKFMSMMEKHLKH